MTRLFVTALGLCFSVPLSAGADTVLASRTIKSKSIIVAEDLVVQKNDAPNALSKLSDVVGLEARVMIYQGRPISPADVGPAAIIERNQIVTLIFLRGGLVIETEARALGRAAPGEIVKVMNLSSRTTVSGTADARGNVVVGTQYTLTN